MAKKEKPEKPKQSKPKSQTKARQAASKMLLKGRGLAAGLHEALAKAADAPRVNMHNYTLIPVPDLAFQYLIGAQGLVSGTVIDILGPEGIGKTTLLYKMMGWAAVANCFNLYIETENKPMMPDRVLQALHPNRKKAKEIFDNCIYFDKQFELTNIVDRIERAVMYLRDKKNKDFYIPLERPIMVGVDTFSKALNPAEAAAFQAYISDALVKRAPKTKDLDPVGGGSNMGHAKIAHAWCRRLPHFLHHYNVILVVIRHQNEDVDMSGKSGGGKFIPQEYKDAHNTKSIGGKAIGQNAALRIILSRGGNITVGEGVSRMKVAEIVKATTPKNSFNEPRQIKYALTLRERESTPEYQEPAITTWYTLAELLQEKGLAGVKIENKNSVSCAALGLKDVLPSIFHGMLHVNEEVLKNLRQSLGILGDASYLNTLTVPEDPDEEDAGDAEDTTKPAESEGVASTLPPPPESPAEDVADKEGDA